MAVAPTVYTGRPIATNTGTTINVDFSRELTLDHESEAPLLTLLNKLRDEPVETYIYKFAVGRFAPRKSLANGAVVAGAVGASATLIVDNGEYFLVGDVIEVPSDHNDATHTNQLIVIDITGNTLTVKAYDPATYGVCTIDDNDEVRVISSAMKEGSSGRPSRQTVPTVYTNYVFSQEDYYDVTRLHAKDRQYTDPERVRLREEARKKHAVDGEYAAFFQKGVVDLTSGGTGGGSTTNPRYQMFGLESQITSNSLTYGAALTDAELYGLMTDIHSPMYSGGNKRLGLASGDLLEQINLMANAAIRITTKDTTWGPNITEVQFAGKVWQWIEAPALSDARAGWGFVVHPGFLKKRTMIPTMFEMNVQNPIDKFYKDGFYSVWSFETRLEEIMGFIKP